MNEWWNLKRKEWERLEHEEQKADTF